MTTHSSILAWEIYWTEEPGGLESMESQKVGHDLVTEQNLGQSKFSISHHHYHHLDYYITLI